MAGKRIDNTGEAEDLRDQFHQVRKPDAHHSYEAGNTPVHAVAGTGMDGIEVDLDKLADAERQLAGLHETLMGHLRNAAKLTDQLPDGTSPVAAPMRQAFLDRADVDGGVQAILQDYVDELFNVRGAILQTLASYRTVDGDAVEMLTQQELRTEGVR